MAPFSFVVCGTNYGRTYLTVLNRLSTECRLSALLALGSRRSIQLAAELGVPLARRADELPPAIDVACFALPSAADSVALELLKRGVHVVCEHPRKEPFLRTALQLADSMGLCFHLNAHFPLLPAPQAFAQACCRFREQFEGRWMRLQCTDRLLYSGLGLMRLCWGLTRFQFAPPRFQAGFALLDGEVEDMFARLEVQVAGLGPEPVPDGSPDYVVDLRLEVGFSEGTLTLTALAGPVIWNWNRHRFSDLPHPLAEEMQPARSGLEMTLCREQANLQSVQEMLSCIRGLQAPPWQHPDHLLEVARCWQTLGSLLGRGDRSQSLS